MENDTVIQVNGVSKKFCRSMKRSMWYGFKDILRDTAGLAPKSDHLRKKEFWAVDDISFELKKGETLGLIGPNGAGKSTILKMLNGIILPDKGSIRIKGRVGALIQIGAGFHPQLTGRENIYINGAILGMGKREIDKKFDAIVEFADIGDFLDTPVKFYSSGMFVRLGFAIAVHCEPDILLVDEVLAVGDLNFQRRCQEKIRKLMKSGTSIIFVSHNMNYVLHICNRAIYMNKGCIVLNASPVEAIESYEQDNLSNSINSSDDLIQTFDSILGPRSSTGEIRITSIKIQDLTGRERKSFFSGEGMRLYSRYYSKRFIENPVLQIGVYREDGIACFIERSSDNSVQVPDFTEGEGQLVILIRNLPLKTGIYVVEILISDRMAIFSYARERGGPFSVVSKVPSYKVGKMGVFRIPVEYEINGRKLSVIKKEDD